MSTYPPEGFHRLVYKFKRFHIFLWDALAYPPRFRNSFFRVVESLVGLGLVYLVPTPWMILVALLAEFLFFEVIEPFGLTGYYWERGPREGDEPGSNSAFWSID